MSGPVLRRFFTNHRIPALILVALSAASVACSGDDPSVDGGGQADAGEVPDAADVDAGDLDSGAPDTGAAPLCSTAFVPPAAAATPTCPLLGNALPAGAAPIRRGDMAAAYDGACNRVIMFFGDRAEPINCGPAASDFLPDGYMFDIATRTWAEITVSGSPVPQFRARSQAVWDAMRNRFILFGGRYRNGTAGAYTFFNDVWAFDPSASTWTLLSPNGPGANRPTERMNFTMNYDGDRDRVLVHGGGTTDFTTFTVDDGTYAFDLSTNTWSEIGTTAALPPKRIFHMSALDRSRGRLYVFGGGGEDAFTQTSFFRDMWVLDFATDTWSQVGGAANTFPEGRIKGEMFYDAARDRVLLFAGHDDSSLGNRNDLWSFSPGTNTWTRITEGDTFNRPSIGFCDFPSDFATVDQCAPERRESHLLVVHGDMATMYGGRTDCGLSNDTWHLDLTTDRWGQVNLSLNGMTCFRSGNPNCTAAGARMCD